MTKKEAAQRLIKAMGQVPQEWVQAVAEKNEDEFYGIMWGTMWIVNDSVDRDRIEKLLKPVDDEEDEMNGSNKVGETGIYAFEVGGELVLGINGAGYDFYEAHWIPLYEALKYEWHDEE